MPGVTSVSRRREISNSPTKGPYFAGARSASWGKIRSVCRSRFFADRCFISRHASEDHALESMFPGDYRALLHISLAPALLNPHPPHILKAKSPVS
jgi:hypothetical protein